MKKLNKKGFTLAELLIVVAIIAVLVAIAIPVFTTRLEQSRETTDIANLRSAYAAAQVAALSGGEDGKKLADGTYYYDPNNGVGVSTTQTALGKGTGTDGKADHSALPSVVKYTNTDDVRDAAIEIVLTNGVVSSVAFAGSSAGGGAGGGAGGSGGGAGGSGGGAGGSGSGS